VCPGGPVVIVTCHTRAACRSPAQGAEIRKQPQLRAFLLHQPEVYKVTENQKDYYPDGVTPPTPEEEAAAKAAIAAKKAKPKANAKAKTKKSKKKKEEEKKKKKKKKKGGDTGEL
jgi:hypothetical protein